MPPPPTFEIDVSLDAVCRGCGAVYPAVALLRKAAVALDPKLLLLPCFCPCGGATFDVRVRIEPLGERQ